MWKDAVSVGVQVMELEIPELLSEQVKQTAISISCKIAEGAIGEKKSYTLAGKATARLETYLFFIAEISSTPIEDYEALLSKLGSIHAQLKALMKSFKY